MKWYNYIEWDRLIFLIIAVGITYFTFNFFLSLFVFLLLWSFNSLS